METSPVIHLVTDAKGTVIHEVHVQMQELPLGMKTLTPEVGIGQGRPLSAQHQALFWTLAPLGTGLTWACLPAVQSGCWVGKWETQVMAGRGNGE